MLKKIFIVLIILFSGCGYKPSANFTPQTIGEKVHTEVEVSLSDPQNAVLVKDAINRALYTRLKSSITNKAKADSTIKVFYKSISFQPLQYDENGYVIYYQAYIRLKFQFIKGEKVVERETLGRYEFPIRPSAIISSSLRFKAIENGSSRALEEFIAYLSNLGVIE